MIRYHRKSSIGREIIAALAVIGFLGLMAWVIFWWPEQQRQGADAYLHTRYAAVLRMERHDRIFGRPCSAGKNRQTYYFTAINRSGQTVTGYLCYTGDNWLSPSPAIVEQSVR